MKFKVFTNFKEETECDNTSGLPFDMRILAYCKDCTYDIAMYLNYLRLLQNTAFETGRFGLLAAGFIPVIMPPSFVRGDLHEAILPALKNKSGLKYYPRPAFSFRGNPYRGDFDDIWVSKMDAAGKLGIPPETVRIIHILGSLA